MLHFSYTYVASLYWSFIIGDVVIGLYASPYFIENLSSFIGRGISLGAHAHATLEVIIMTATAKPPSKNC